MLTYFQAARGLLAVGGALLAGAGTAELTISGRGPDVRGTFTPTRCGEPYLPGGRGVRANLGVVFEVPYPGGTFTLLDRVRRREGAQPLATQGGSMTASLTLADGTRYVLARKPGAVVVAKQLHLVAFDVWLRPAADTTSTRGLVRVHGHCACP
jgi:hypothetical protein